VFFHRLLRPDQQFTGLEAMKVQLQIDKEQALQVLKTNV
jgi:FAD synthase